MPATGPVAILAPDVLERRRRLRRNESAHVSESHRVAPDALGVIVVPLIHERIERVGVLFPSVAERGEGMAPLAALVAACTSTFALK